MVGAAPAVNALSPMPGERRSPAPPCQGPRVPGPYDFFFRSPIPAQRFGGGSPRQRDKRFSPGVPRAKYRDPFSLAYEDAMRAEIEAAASEIRDSLTLLRRHL